MDSVTNIDLLLRGTATGAQLGLGIALARSANNRSLRIATLLFIIANAAFTLNGSAAVQQIFGPLQPGLWFLQIGSAGLFWLFVVTLFEDQPLTPLNLSPSASLIILGLVGQFGPHAIRPAIWTAHNLIGLGLALYAILVIVRSGASDLIEARRRLRVPFLGLLAAYSALLSAAQIGEIIGVTASWYQPANALAQAMLGVAGVGALLEGRRALFGSARSDDPNSAAVPAADVDGMWLERLSRAMDEDALWRQEGLTIGDLAEKVGLPEHRLRRLINDRLGHRNFPAFINQKRIETAASVLADPARASRTVASIAFDLGFGSLGPFNRAFRDVMGVTPTEFRRRAFAKSSPISGMPR